MASRQPAYRRPSYRVPFRLLELSQPYALERNLPIISYGRAAIMLLNFTSTQEFGPTTTRLITPQHIAIPFPELNIPVESPDRKQLSIQMPVVHATLHEQYAQRDNISVHDRAAQAFRLANFIAERYHPLDPVVFQHNEEPPITLKGALQ